MWAVVLRTLKGAVKPLSSDTLEGLPPTLAMASRGFEGSLSSSRVWAKKQTFLLQDAGSLHSCVLYLLDGKRSMREVAAQQKGLVRAESQVERLKR